MKTKKRNFMNTNCMFSLLVLIIASMVYSTCNGTTEAVAPSQTEGTAFPQMTGDYNEMNTNEYNKMNTTT